MNALDLYFNPAPAPRRTRKPRKAPPPEFLKLMEAATAMREAADCCVMALAITCDLPYEEAHALAAEHGRRHRCGMYLPQIVASFEAQGRQLECLHSIYRNVADRGPDKPAWCLRAKTAISLEKALPSRGIFVAFTKRRRHILACRGGKVIDWTAGRRHHIAEIYRVRRSA